LQEPFLFTGTVRDNILYGNEEYQNATSNELLTLLKEKQLDSLLVRFEKGLDTTVGAGDAISLGQKQLIAFMRAVLRNPKLLILDEATANIDTVTEQLLEEILKKLPEDTTKVIIAHRLNTIQNADDIFFVNGGAHSSSCLNYPILTINFSSRKKDNRNDCPFSLSYCHYRFFRMLNGEFQFIFHNVYQNSRSFFRHLS
jgi:ATP-binding cassette subfamily B protein